MDSVDELAASLRHAIGRLVRVARREGDDLPAAQTATLGFLSREGSLTIADLARRRGVKHQGQSRTVAELTGLGYVERAVSGSDGRVSVITLTDAGRAALQREMDARADWLATAIRAETTAEERALLERLPALFERLAGHDD